MTAHNATVSPALMLRVEELFYAQASSVYNVAYRIVWNRSDAEDVVQATFVKAFTRIDQLSDPSKARPWLLQVAYREAITVIRRRKDVPTDPEEMPATVSTLPGPGDQAVASAIAVELSKALEKISPNERLAVVLRDIEGLAMTEVAEVLGVGLSAAKMRVSRGRQSLRVLLENTELM